jgi:hypothetical protein
MWILASRGRPQHFQRFVDCWIETKASTTVYVRLDECDPTIEEYKKIIVPPEFIVIIGSRARLGKAMNELFEKYPNEKFYGLLADDLIPQTEYWDQLLINAAGLNKISQANDLTRNPKICMHPCIGGDLVRAAGFFGFPLNVHYCLEVVWKEVSRCFKGTLKYLPNVIVENAHPDYGKATVDQTYIEANLVRDQDHKNWENWFSTEWENFCKKIKPVITR